MDATEAPPSLSPKTEPNAQEMNSNTPPSPQSPSTSVCQLEIPPRLQWTHGHGFCGEMAVQSILLFHGNYLSQRRIRELAGSEILIGTGNEVKALKACKLEFELYSPPKKSKANKNVNTANEYLKWIKSHLLEHHPVIFTVFISDGERDDEYDHIVLATGLKADEKKEDVLVFNSFFSETPVQREFGSFPALRHHCDKTLVEGGNIPQKVINYGAAITGQVDLMRETYPLTLRLPSSSEPAKAEMWKAKLTARKLKVGERYGIIRYDSNKKVPDMEFFQRSQQQGHSSVVAQFVAEAETMEIEDPTPFSSDGGVFYRCVVWK
eukprot:TRINITY_DN4479_c0_g1_i2.p1 TRINITY_DN4479_c0_g1~~TRINITY_DN4479_c0_g1_i2.p1  ORF type:complete len:335 (+),score=94.66 TRINITY_DN4479_c0_g1_i2:42-1007(+)